MKKMTDRQKTLIKWMCVLVLMALIAYVFRDMAEPIWQQLVQTSPKVLAAITLATLAYGVVESAVTYVFVRQIDGSMTFVQTNVMTYFVSFYRVSTLGSGALVAAVLFMRRYGITGSRATGMYAIDYAIHKLTIAVIAVGLYLTHYAYMREVFGEYNSYVVLGVVATVFITAGIVLFACWPAFHRFLIWLLGKADKLTKGRFSYQIQDLCGQCAVMEESSRLIMRTPSVIVKVFVLDLVKFSCWFIIPYIVCYSLLDIDILTVTGITAMSVMLAAVVPMPGGIGSSELIMTAIYSGVVGTVAAGAMALLYRFATFVFPFLLGIPAAIWFARGRKKTVGGDGV